ncbi:MAG: hypothetical protein AAFX54_03140 [Pseudomonadota bacterium]
MPTLKKTNKLKLHALLAASFTLLAAGPASACYTVKFKNESKKDVRVLWEAGGCAGVRYWESLVCDGKTAKPGQTVSYNFKWGTTGPRLVAYADLNAVDFPNKKVDFVLRHNKFSPAKNGKNGSDTPPSCGRSYSISFSEDDRKKYL